MRGTWPEIEAPNGSCTKILVIYVKLYGSLYMDPITWTGDKNEKCQ